jgi:hypothetical protein
LFGTGTEEYIGAGGGRGAHANRWKNSQQGLTETIMQRELIDVLQKVGKPVETYQGPDGTCLLILPYGGRMLGLFSPQSEENFYWTHTALDSVDTAEAFYASQQWHNSGGDRTWLAPEADIFFPNFPSLDTYFQPRQLDPGNYAVTKTDGAVKLVNRLSLTLSRSKQTIDLEMSKSFGPAPNPLRHERGLDGVAALEYAGYTQFSTLAIAGPNAAISGPVGLWNLVQMPHGGELWIATFHRNEPRVVMGKISPDDLHVDDHRICYHMRAAGEHKLSVRATATTGRVGYLYKTGDRWALIVRNFFVNPSGEYVDPPWADPAYLGFSVQACNVNSGLGSFSELEYHIPAVGRSTGRTRCDDASVVWAFRGPQEPIMMVARLLLGTDA